MTKAPARVPVASRIVSEPTPRPARRPARTWERLLGVVGRVLVATGLLLLAFVGYQLWGTGIEQAQRQNELSSAFERLLATTTTTAPTDSPGTSSSVPDAVATTTNPGSPPPTTAVVVPLRPPELGEPVARLDIPRLDVRQVVVMGVGTGELKKGPGHFPDTPLPGQLGNAAIAGHRTSYGAPFGDLDRLEVGDEIVVETVQGTFTYRVSGSQVVAPTAVEVVDTVDPTRATLTLVTCHPKYSTKERLIVSAELDTTVSDQTVAPPPSTTPPPASTEPSTPSDGTTAPVTVPPLDEPANAEFAEVDPFAAGWFADDGAWWHVAGWGLLLTAIALGATRFGKVRRNQRLGAVVGILPFLVVLYFFFQNVNRLLPPGL